MQGLGDARVCFRTHRASVYGVYAEPFFLREGRPRILKSILCDFLCPLHLAVTCLVSWSPGECEISDIHGDGFRKMFLFSALGSTVDTRPCVSLRGHMLLTHFLRDDGRGNLDITLRAPGVRETVVSERAGHCTALAEAKVNDLWVRLFWLSLSILDECWAPDSSTQITGTGAAFVVFCLATGWLRSVFPQIGAARLAGRGDLPVYLDCGKVSRTERERCRAKKGKKVLNRGSKKENVAQGRKKQHVSQGRHIFPQRRNTCTNRDGVSQLWST